MQEKNNGRGWPGEQIFCPTTPKKRSGAVFWAAAFGGLTLLGSLLMGTLLGWTQNPGWPLAPLALAGAALGRFWCRRCCGRRCTCRCGGSAPGRRAQRPRFCWPPPSACPGWPRPGPAEACFRFCWSRGFRRWFSRLAHGTAGGGRVLPAAEYRLLALLPGLLPRVPAANRFAQVFLSLLLPLLFLIAISEDWSVPAEQQETPAKGRRALAWAATALPCLALIAFCGLAARLPHGHCHRKHGAGDSDRRYGGDGPLGPCRHSARRRDCGGAAGPHHRTPGGGGVRQEAGEPLYVTQGDANNAPDEEPAAQSQVEGRMIGLVPALGRISLWFRHRRLIP